MVNTITVENGLSAYFKQPAGPSRAGVDWIVQIAGATTTKVIVRTYFTSGSPQPSEMKALADKAALFVRRKLEQGWVPGEEVLEVRDDISA